jgi:hypothetical protein
VKWFHQDASFGYRFIPVWEIAFMIASTVALLLLHREWLKHGGKTAYQSPDPEVAR